MFLRRTESRWEAAKKKTTKNKKPGADLWVQERGTGGGLVRAETGKVGVGSGNAASLN